LRRRVLRRRVLCRLTSASLMTALDAPLAPLLTPLHARGLCVSVGGWNCEAQRGR
jgi:hypothetical protein